MKFACVEGGWLEVMKACGEIRDFGEKLKLNVVVEKL